MSGTSNYLGNALLNYVRGTPIPTAPTGLYVGLFNGDPTDTGGGGAEVTTTIRAAGRVAVTLNAASNKSTTNSAPVDFGNAAGAAIVTHFGIFDAPAGGNMYLSYPVSSGAGAISQNTPVAFATGALSWTA